MSDAVETRTKRTHHAELPLELIKIVPEENYRWTNAILMREELAKVERDPSDGSLVNTFEMLKASIQAIGIDEPIGVVMRDDGFYHVVYGFTRAVAAKELNLRVIPAYVYDPSLPDAEARLLQMRENSIALKRPVNWVNEVKMFRDLSRQYQIEYDSGKVPLPFAEDGSKMTSRDAASDRVCRVLGKSANSMRTRLQTFEKVDQRVKDLAKFGKFTYNVTLEFLPVKDKVGMSAEVVGEVLAEMRRRDPEFKTTTPETVRQVYKWVVESRAALTAPAEPESETDSPVRLTPHVEQNLHNMSPATARDLAVAMVIATLKGLGLNHDSPAETLEKLRNMPTWQRVIGIGIGTSQIVSPLVAGKSFDIHAHNYAMRVFLAAFLRRFIPGAEDRQRFDAWHSALTTRGAVQVMNRVEFANAIEAAMSEFDHRSKFKDIVTKAMAELKSRLFR